MSKACIESKRKKGMKLCMKFEILCTSLASDQAIEELFIGFYYRSLNEYLT